jgi:hypothetical protein
MSISYPFGSWYCDIEFSPNDKIQFLEFEFVSGLILRAMVLRKKNQSLSSLRKIGWSTQVCAMCLVYSTMIPLSKHDITLKEPLEQSCEWNDKSVNRERESRTRIGSDATFFWDSLSNLVIDDNFRISNNLGLGLAANISTALALQPERDREIEIIKWFF